MVIEYAIRIPQPLKVEQLHMRKMGSYIAKILQVTESYMTRKTCNEIQSTMTYHLQRPTVDCANAYVQH